MDNRFDYIRHPRTKREYFHSLLRRISDEKPTDYVLTTSSMLRPIFASAFQTKRIIIAGYPRNDCLVSDKLQLLTIDENEQLELIKRHKTQKKIVLYMPTFRDSEINFFDIIDINKFHSFLVKENIQFLFKLHPKSKLKERFNNLRGQNFSFIHQASDPYPLLKYTDFLVTDYSSIYFDYLITDKPIIFFPYDLKEYLSNSRDLYFDYLSFTPGPKVYNEEGLEKALLEVDIFGKERQRIKKMVFDDVDVKCLAGEELFHKLQRILNVEGKQP
jgi:CDP-glycerol glycerophosphotransferase (TagB/SpsB family)